MITFTNTLSKSNIFVEFVLFQVLWVKILSNLPITLHLSKLKAVALLYFLESWKLITFINRPIKIMSDYFYKKPYQSRVFCWIRIISCILNKGFCKCPHSVIFSKLTPVDFLYFLNSWKLISFTKSPLKLMFLCWIHVISCSLKKSSIKCFHNVLFTKVNSSTPSVFS